MAKLLGLVLVAVAVIAVEGKLVVAMHAIVGLGSPDRCLLVCKRDT